jgi:hypothetical protein
VHKPCRLCFNNSRFRIYYLFINLFIIESGPRDSPGQICNQIEDSNLLFVLFYRFFACYLFYVTYFKTEVDLFLEYKRYTEKNISKNIEK